jgi:transglutaminase-like putative cysteine protease
VHLLVRHETRYRYRKPVALGQHRLVLRPREGHDLELIRQALVIEPSNTVRWMRDAHDNVIAMVDFESPSDALTIVNELEVRRSAPFPLAREEDVANSPWPVVYEDREAPLLDAYRLSNFPPNGDRIREWAAATVRDANAQDARSTVIALCQAIHKGIAYRRRMERGVQTPVETLERASGSCRDLATLLMEVARSVGLAARFASGYLHGTASMAGHASTHAWAEIYLPRVGWLGLDPTLGQLTDLRHVVVGVAHHPRGVMPVSGTFNGTSTDLLEHSVRVHTEERGV